MILTQSISTGAPINMLTGSYVIKRVTTTGTAGGTVTFYDARTSKTQNFPGMTVALGNANKTTKTNFQRLNPPTGSQTDCGGVTRIYQYDGMGYDAPVDIAANAAKPLPGASAFPNGTTATDTNIVVTRGLLVEAVTQPAVVTIEYYPNLSSA